MALYNPLTSNWGRRILVAGHPLEASNESAASSNQVSADYRQNLGVTMVQGRAFTMTDNETAAPVAVVNEAFVKRFFKGGEDPLDRHFGIDLPEIASTFRIVGIVRDSEFVWSGLTEPARPLFFGPLVQHVDYEDQYDEIRLFEMSSHFIGGIMLVSDSSPGVLDPLLRRTLAEADPNLTIASSRTMQQQIDLLCDRGRAVASLSGLFGFVALLLTWVGVYGVTAYMVAQQTNEFGLRMALGADPAKVIKPILSQAFHRVAAGFVVGLLVAVGVAKFMAAQLYGVSFWDPLAHLVAAGSLVGWTFFAAVISADRAASISPMSAQRTEKGEDSTLFLGSSGVCDRSPCRPLASAEATAIFPDPVTRWRGPCAATCRFGSHSRWGGKWHCRRAWFPKSLAALPLTVMLLGKSF